MKDRRQMETGYVKCKLESKDMKMDRKCINKLRFADDVMLVNKRGLEIEKMMKEILKATS